MMVGSAKRHHTLIVEQLAHLCLRALHDLKGGVADEEQQHEDDHYAGSHAGMASVSQSITAMTKMAMTRCCTMVSPIDAEAVDGQVPDDNGKAEPL